MNEPLESVKAPISHLQGPPGTSFPSEPFTGTADSEVSRAASLLYQAMNRLREAEVLPCAGQLVRDRMESSQRTGRTQLNQRE